MLSRALIVIATISNAVTTIILYVIVAEGDDTKYKTLVRTTETNLYIVSSLAKEGMFHGKIALMSLFSFRISNDLPVINGMTLSCKAEQTKDFMRLHARFQSAFNGDLHGRGRR